MIFGSDKITFTVIRYILVEFQETSVSDILFSHMYRKKRRFWKKPRLHLNIHIYCLGNVLWTEIFTSVQILMQQNMAVFNINCLLPTGEVIQQNINVMFYRLTAEIKFVSILNQNTCFEFYQFWHFKKRKSELGNFFLEQIKFQVDMHYCHPRVTVNKLKKRTHIINFMGVELRQMFVKYFSKYNSGPLYINL